MHYRRLGRAGTKVSEIAYGSWITAGGKYDRETSVACHTKAFELGVTCFDTADVYSAGEAEEVVGIALREISRKDVVLATKCRGSMGKGPNDSGLGRKHILEACEASLRRLKTDYIDLYQAHWWDEAVPLEETVRAFDDLVRQGKIVYWGISNWSAVQVRDAVAICDRRGFDRPQCHQPRYNMFHREIEQDLMPVCKEYGLGFIVYSPLEQGLLAGRYLGQKVPEGSRATVNKRFGEKLLTKYNAFGVEELNKLAQEIGLPLSTVALAWILRRDEISACIVGASRPEQVEENVKASGVKLDETALAKIQKILDQRWAMVLDEDAERLRTGAEPRKDD